MNIFINVSVAEYWNGQSTKGLKTSLGSQNFTMSYNLVQQLDRDCQKQIFHQIFQSSWMTLEQEAI